MNKSDIEWKFESQCRIAINYAGLRHAFFNKVNILLCVLSIASLWCSGFVFTGGYKCASCVLNIAGSLMLVADVALNLLGCNGFWKAMSDGYSELLAEFTAIRSTATATELEELMSRFVKFDARCSASFDALGLIAWNEACVQMGKTDRVKHVPWYKRLTANFCSWGSVADNFKDDCK